MQTFTFYFFFFIWFCHLFTKWQTCLNFTFGTHIINRKPSTDFIWKAFTNIYLNCLYLQIIQFVCKLKWKKINKIQLKGVCQLVLNVNCIWLFAGCNGKIIAVIFHIFFFLLFESKFCCSFCLFSTMLLLVL